MNLKNVKIYGFKTFADRTEFSLEGGLIAVVGSNGCGKSNLVDALLWGLGEGNARQLRASTGVDVIFNGSSKRKPLSFAEVQIMFDNEDGELPAPTSEVVITRRLTRGGESEYRINNSVCRLRDVYELLADSGLGRSGYAIVGQREIDSAVSASAEDRRGWIDEAAGVQRYRQRKMEAQRRLSSAEQHLQRTRDVLQELENQREPLRAEAETARRYKEISGAARRLEVSILRRDYVQSGQELEKNARNRDRNLETTNAAKKQELDSEELYSTLEKNLAVTSEAIELNQSQFHEAVRAAERTESDQKLVELKIDGLRLAEAELKEHGEGTTARSEEARLELESCTNRLSEEESKLSQVIQSGSDLGGVGESLRKEISELTVKLDLAKKQEAERLKSEAEAAHAKARLREIARELEGIDRTAQDTLDGYEEAEATAKRYREQSDHLKSQCDLIRKQIGELDQTRASIQREHQDSLEKRARISGRLQGLQIAMDAHEGLAHGARAVLEAARKGEIEGGFTSVGEAIQCPPALALAIDTALGGSVNDLIVEHELIAKRAIEWLKFNRKGRVTFQPIALMRVLETNRELRDLSNRPKVMGIASELVQSEPRYQPVVVNLLGRVLVVEDLDVGLNLAKSGSRCFSRIVTKQGEVIHASGAVTGGAQHGERSGLVQRKSELSQLEIELAKIDKETKSRIAQLEGFTQEESLLREGIRVNESKLLELEPDLRDSESFAASLKLEIASSEKEKTKLEKERLTLGQVRAPQSATVDIESTENERQELLSRLAVASAEAVQHEERVQDQTARLKQARAQLDAVQRRVDASQTDEAKRAEKLAEIEPERTRLKEELLRLGSELETFRMSSAAIQERLEAEIAERSKLQVEMQQVQTTLVQTRSQVEALIEVSHRLEVDRARLESKRSVIAERLIDEYEFADSELESWRDFEPVEDGADRIMAQFKRELKGMGEVNLGAIDAFDRLSSRFNELFAQQDDIENGIAEINQAILELDSKTKGKFLEALGLVQMAFRRILARLFEGGEGDLVLTDPQNVLNSGIEMDVTLPGKRRQALALLSGGERSLCAMAFLFALLEVKTSPLVVLDEVDAPLDGYNLERYINLIKEFSEKSQVIVITHNPNTIASCPIWLGVTMKEPGVSTLVPYVMPPEVSEQRVPLVTQISR